MKLKKFKIIALFIALAIFMASCTTTGGGSNYKYVTPKTDELKLTASWEDKDFLADGIGVVTVRQNVDGDTTIFKTAKTNKNITVRYLGVDTPESTYQVDQWGFAASDFTKEKLKSAKTIVLQANSTGSRQDNNGRYLAWVWYRTSDTEDFRLLNLEIVENGYSASEASGTDYSNVFLTADAPLQKARVRIWGQVDPSYDSSDYGVSLTLKELRENYTTLNVVEQNKAKGKVIRVSGIVSREIGLGSAYLQQYDEETDTYYSIYVYGGFTESDLKLGREVYVQGKIGYYNGSLQITDLDRGNSGIISLNNEVHIEEVTVEEYLKNEIELQCQLIKLTNITVKNGYNTKDENNSPTKAFTLYAVDENNNEISIRVSNEVNLIIAGENEGNRITAWEYFKDKTISEITAIVGWYSQLNDDETEYLNDGLQLILISGSDIVLN